MKHNTEKGQRTATRREEARERCILREDGDYPSALRQIRNAPARLYVRGCLPDENIASVAIIGARSCSFYGKEMAEWFAGELAAAGVQIISGMALGIDGIAQRAALSVGGRSFGVLGCGTDICYPAANRDLYERLLSDGGVISEHGQGTPPLPKHFPSRNRLISALSDAVLVVEARQRSGTLITVDFALEQGRDVYVLPGRVTDELSRGCNSLLGQGAGIALSPSDILESLEGRGRLAPRMREKDDGSPAPRMREKDSGSPAPRMRDEKGDGSSAWQEHDKKRDGAATPEGSRASVRLDEREMIVWEQMGDRPVSMQELYARIRRSEKGADMGLPEATAVLMNLAMREIVYRERGDRYCRSSRAVSSI